MRVSAVVIAMYAGVIGKTVSAVALTGASWSNIAWGYDDAGKDVTEGVDIVLLDLDDQTDLVDDLHANGITVLCYLSGGSYEEFRDYADANGVINQTIVDLWQEVSVATLDGFDDEKWVDISRLSDLKILLTQRFDKAKALNCDGVEVDNVDCFQNKECRLNLQAGALTEAQARPLQLDFNLWQTEYVHSLNMSIGLKNCLDLVDDLSSNYEFAVNEQCLEFDECDVLQPFLDDGKLVLHVEYTLKNSNCDIDQQDPGFLTKMCKGKDGVCEDTEWTSCFLNFTGVHSHAMRSFSSSLYNVFILSIAALMMVAF